MFKAEFTPAVRNTDFYLQVLCMSIHALTDTNFCYIEVLLLKKHPFYTGKGIRKKTLNTSLKWKKTHQI